MYTLNGYSLSIQHIHVVQINTCTSQVSCFELSSRRLDFLCGTFEIKQKH